jgi:hypothetical protein
MRLAARKIKAIPPMDPKAALEERIKKEAAEKEAKKLAKKQKKLEAIQPIDQDISEQMGFGGFGTSKIK